MTLNIKSFFKEAGLRSQYQAKINEIYRRSLLLDFNPLDFTKWNENKVSEIISFFLNPHASHGQGDLYLRMFIEYFNLSFKFPDISKVVVILEEHTDYNRRVDIVISYDDFKYAIGIENKIYPWTKDQPFQVADYITHLRKYCKTNDYCLLYLAPQGKVLDKSSAGDNFEEMLADGKLKSITYEEQFIPLVHRFAMHTDNERLRSFIKDFELKLRNNFIGTTMNEQNDMVIFIKESEENLRLAFQIANNLKTVKEELKRELYKQMNELAEELNLVFVEEHNHFILPNFRNLYAKFSFEGGGLIYGMVKTPKYFHDYPEKIFIRSIESELKTKFSTSPWWPLWKYLYEKIDIYDNLWIDIKSRKIKDTFKDFLLAIINLPPDLTNEY